jgi:hypothetical protein
MAQKSRGEILRPPEGRFRKPCMVVRYKEIGEIVRPKHRKKVMFLSQIFFRWKQYYFVDVSCTVLDTPDFFLERNTKVCATLPPEGPRISSQALRAM